MSNVDKKVKQNENWKRSIGQGNRRSLVTVTKSFLLEWWDESMRGVALRKNRKTASGNREKRLIF